MLTTKLVIFLVGGGAALGSAGTWVASDVMGRKPVQPCAVVFMPTKPPEWQKEKPVGVQEVFGNFSDLLQQGKHK
jgi:hypothetical protein